VGGGLKACCACRNACAEALLTAHRGGARRLLVVNPRGFGVGKDTHLSVFLELQDTLWAPSAEYKLTLVNQADVSKSHLWGKSQQAHEMRLD
jgi:hypothetical protein